jgi:aspartyl-tRNA(Asn)/glutamyl-tRNA(Gln) amidotransferase subunit A
VLQRLDAAGAVDLGGLNMSEFACNPFGLNILVGPARNPWDRARIAGGSSSGSAAAVAAGLVFGALGSDTGGSVRLPAALCGVVGLLPTRGRVSRNGAMELSPSLDAVGPLARSVRDCALLFGAICDPDPACETRTSAARIGVLSDNRIADLAPEVRIALSRAMAALRDGGIELVAMPTPDFAGLNARAALVMLPEMSSLHAKDLRDAAAEYTPWVRNRLSAGFGVAASDHAAALSARGPLTAAFIERHLGKTDALLLPVHTEPAAPLGEILDEVAGRRPPRADLGSFTRWTNYVGLPAVTVPCGLADDRLPTAVQLVGRPFSEALLFGLARRIETGVSRPGVPKV